MTSSAPPNPSHVPVPTPNPTSNGTAPAASPKDQQTPPPPPQQQQQQQGGQEEAAAAAADGGGAEAAEAGAVAGVAGEAMEVDGSAGAGDAEAGGGAQQPSPVTVFRIRLKQPPASLRHKMRVPELCRNFSAVAWCGKLNAIACASETCARIPSSNSSPPFWIPIHILNPERPTECSVFNVKADSPRDFVQFIEWSPRSCPRAMLVANFHGRITIWTQPTKGPVNLVRDASSWQCEHEWRQDLSVVTKWLSGISPYRWLPANSTSSNLKTFEEKFLTQQPQSSGWPSIRCVCSVFSSGSVQLHWSQWPSQNSAQPRWFSTSKGLLGAGPSGIMAADAIITESGALHVAGVPLVNPSTVVVWEVMPGLGSGIQATAKINATNTVPPSLNPPSWPGFAPLAAYLFSLQDYLVSEGAQTKKQTDNETTEAASIHCCPVSNFSAYVSPEAAAQSATTTTWGSGVTSVAFDPTRGGSVITVVIVEGQYMSPYDPDEGPSITGWRVQCWESSLQPVVLHPIFGSPTSFGGQPPMQTVWSTRVNKSIPPTEDLKNPQTYVPMPTTSDERSSSECSVDRANRLTFDPYDLPNDVRQLAQIVYSAHGGEVAVAFLRGGVHIFSGPNFDQVDSYHVNVGSAIAPPAFSSSSCCLASVWHDTLKDRTILKIIRVLPPAILNTQIKVSSAVWERAIADRFWWSLLAGVDWWDAVGCTQSAAEDGIVSLNSVIAFLDTDFHSLPTMQQRQQHCPNLDRIKCRLLEGTNAQDVRALVLDMQARLLLDMLGKGIESALINPSTLLPEPWQASSDTLSSIEPDKMTVEPALLPSIQGYVDAVLDLASHFITRLRRYASFCRTLASHAVGPSSTTGTSRNMVTSPTNSSPSPSNNQGNQGGATSTTGNSQMQEWVQGAIAKISNNSDGAATATPNPMSGRSSFMPISINTGTFPGTPAVRLIGDCHFLHRLCQLLLFCLLFRRRQSPRLLANAQKNQDSAIQKIQHMMNAKAEDNGTALRSGLGAAKVEDGPATRAGQFALGAKGPEENPIGKSVRIGSGNAGQGYTSDEVKVLFLILVDLCRRTSTLQHPLPASQVGSSNIIIRLHYIDGNYTVLPEVVEASLGPHMQNMPRPRGADAAGLLLRELELQPPAEEWHRRNMFGGPWSEPDDFGPLDNMPHLKISGSINPHLSDMEEDGDSLFGIQSLWPRKRRLSERDAAFGLKTSVGLGSYLGVMGSRRDAITAVWKTGLDGEWYKCIRCLRQTCAFAHPGAPNPTNEREAWWISRWTHACPMCGGSWVKVV
ncbi:mediator of RNA polymerase II transcription subunit 16-like isoform X2 [Phragmites australis]|uniref:mediator of RNA polymerase II transcription subunit 16-like isoform X2 n=1 Tax=Phragmites australis TaxID=29695 RepID=UPI002D77706B|nr:mediator of RNA polymerase II transcription subunit 16-like isoform X2 [Phragmites australis]